MRPTFQLRLPLAAALSLGLLATTAAEAARLTEVSRHEVRQENGEPVEPAPGPRRVTAAATGAGSIGHSADFAVPPPPPAAAPEEGTQTLDSQVVFLIEPEAGESIGDCVMVDFSFVATAIVTATGDADARVGFGGFGATSGTDPVGITFGGPTQITLNPGPEEVVQLASGPVTASPGDPSIALVEEGSFLARIGDEVQLNLASATAWNVPPGDEASGTTEAALEAEVREGIVACPASPITEIPTLDQWGLGGLALLLAGAGFLVLARRRLA